MDALLRKYVAVDPKVCHGKPCFRGTRIPVHVILELLEGGIPAEEIVGREYYPRLRLAHVRAALHFAAEYAKHQEYAVFRSPVPASR